MSEPTPAGTSEFTHDVFISYSHRDRDLVVGELMGALKAANLRVLIDSENFEFGAVASQSMEEAVKKSRHTLAVVTENYQKSGWSTLEIQLALLSDPDGRNRRLIPLLFEPVALPDLMQRLTYADFTKLEERGQVMAKLLEQLGLSRQAVMETATQSATRGIESLRHFLTTGDVRVQIARFKQEFDEGPREGMKLLAGYKALHDEFHKAMIFFRTVADRKKELLKVCEAGADDADEEEREKAWEAFGNAADGLYTLLHGVIRQAEETFREDPPLWIDDLRGGETDLIAAVSNQSLDGVKEGVRVIHRVIGSQPADLNRRLVEEASRLDFGRVMTPLRAILETLIAANFGGEAGQRLADFAEGLQSFERLQQTLKGLVRNHDCLQSMDDELAPWDDEMPEPPRIRSGWPRLEKRRLRLSATSGGAWFEPMQAAALAVQQQLDSESAAPDAALWAKGLRQKVKGFRKQVTDAFGQTDHDLNSLCAQLGEFERNVTQALDRMNQ